MPKIHWCKEYWALRHDTEWKRTHTKIASPLAAMTTVWGNSVLSDPVLALGLEPTPWCRGEERWATTFEIVDLGRNKKIAEESFKALEEDAKVEKSRRALLARDIDAEVVAMLTTTIADGTKSLDVWAKTSGSSLRSAVNHAFDARVEAEVFADTADDVQRLITGKERYNNTPNPTMPPRAAITATIDAITEALLNPHERSHDYYSNAWRDLYDMKSVMYRAKFRERLLKFVQLYAEHDTARAVEDRRFALRRRTVEEMMRPAAVTEETR